jgi:hypothetical protein
MIWPAVEILVLLLTIAVFVVLVVALAVAAVLGLLAFRVVRKAHRAVGRLRWPKERERQGEAAA